MGQEQDKKEKAYRTGILGTCKALYVEGSRVLFSTNHFIINRTRLEFTCPTVRGKYPARLRLFVHKRSEPDENDPVWFVNVGKNFESANFIDYEVISPQLLSGIRFLSVRISDQYSSWGPRLCWEKYTPGFSLRFTAHVNEVCRFLYRCKKVHSLRLVFQWDSNWNDGDEDDVFEHLRQLSRPIGAKNVALFTRLDLSTSIFTDVEFGEYVLSAGYHQHVMKSLRMPKGSEIPGFNGGNLFQEVDHLQMPWEKLKEGSGIESVSGDPNLVATEAGWNWK